MVTENTQQQQSLLGQLGLGEFSQQARSRLDPYFGQYASYLPGGEYDQQLTDLRGQEDAGLAALDAPVQQALGDARTRAQLTEAQLRNAGMLGLANQLQTSQRNIAFDTARRGTLGGSRSIERSQQAQGQYQAGIGQVAAQAAQAGENQFRQDVAPVFGAQQQAYGQSPLSGLGNQFLMEDLNQRGQGAQGQFDISNTQNQIRQNADMNRAQSILGTLGSVAGGITAAVQ